MFVQRRGYIDRPTKFMNGTLLAIFAIFLFSMHLIFIVEKDVKHNKEQKYNSCYELYIEKLEQSTINGSQDKN